MTYQMPSRPRGSLPLGIVMGVIVGAIAVMFAWFLVVDDPDSATPAPSPSVNQPAESPQAPEPSGTPTPDAPASAEAPPTSDAPTQPDPAATPGEGDAPAPGITTELPVGSFVTVLQSLPKSSTTPEQAVARAAEWSQHGYTAIVIDTDAFDGLNSGYWAVVIPGQTTRDGFREICAQYDLGPQKCYPREIKG